VWDCYKLYGNISMCVFAINGNIGMCGFPINSMYNNDLCVFAINWMVTSLFVGLL